MSWLGNSYTWSNSASGPFPPKYENVESGIYSRRNIGPLKRDDAPIDSGLEHVTDVEGRRRQIARFFARTVDFAKRPKSTAAYCLALASVVVGTVAIKAEPAEKAETYPVEPPTVLDIETVDVNNPTNPYGITLIPTEDPAFDLGQDS